jgi:hypothetical protein
MLSIKTYFQLKKLIYQQNLRDTFNATKKGK